MMVSTVQIGRGDLPDRVRHYLNTRGHLIDVKNNVYVGLLSHLPEGERTALGIDPNLVSLVPLKFQYNVLETNKMYTLFLVSTKTQLDKILKAQNAKK